MKDAVARRRFEDCITLCFRGARDIPGAAEAEGYAILESTARDGLFHLTIER